MSDKVLSEDSIPESIIHLFLTLSNTSSLNKALEYLIETAKTSKGRTELSLKNLVSATLQLCQSLSYPSSRHNILLSLKLIRNLCAGEISNQNSFLIENGVNIISTIIHSSSSDYEIIRMGLQLLGNVSLAGSKHQCAIWRKFFPLNFHKIAEIQSKETCDPLCMVMFTCCEGSNGLLEELCSNQGTIIVKSILQTALSVELKEEWFNLLLTKICIEGSIFSKFDSFSDEQSFLLRILSNTLSEQINDITVSSFFALSVLKLLKSAINMNDTTTRCNLTLPTGFKAVDILGYSLTILRDICACDGQTGDNVDILVSEGLIDVILSLLRELEPPTSIRKAINEEKSSTLEKPCIYNGYRRDLVSIIGNCAYRRKHVQDEIRGRNGILLLLQQCVTDEENPYLREWGIWTVRNILEGNVENQRLVSEMELQGAAHVPQIAQLGLKVEVDPKSRRAKLVNLPS